MTIKPLKEWKTVSKCFFLVFGFFFAMWLFPSEPQEQVIGDVQPVIVEAPADFFSVFREEREKQRGEKEELYQNFMEEENVTEEEKRQTLTNLEMLYQKNATEDKVEAILKGRGYEDIIFSYEETLSLLIVKGAELSKEEKASLAQFIQVYTNVAQDNLTIFSVSQ